MSFMGFLMCSFDTWTFSCYRCRDFSEALGVTHKELECCRLALHLVLLQPL